MTISTVFKRDLRESSPMLYITKKFEEFIDILKQNVFVLLINFGNWFSLINRDSNIFVLNIPSSDNGSLCRDLNYFCHFK